MSTGTEIAELYQSSWRAQQELFDDERVGPRLLRCATPVISFGRWRTAQVITAGLNPSEREFLDRHGRELSPAARRFLHRTSAAHVEPSGVEVAEALRLAEGYFELGNAYTEWFDGFAPLLDALGCSYRSGRACHTDYVSPFATKAGIGKDSPAVRALLESDGMPRWVAMLKLMPDCRTVIGVGAGWTAVQAALGFETWQPLPTPLDTKGGRTRSPRPHLLHATHFFSREPVDIFWWRPNRGEPLSYLSRDEKVWLGQFMLTFLR